MRSPVPAPLLPAASNGLLLIRSQVEQRNLIRFFVCARNQRSDGAYQLIASRVRRKELRSLIGSSEKITHRTPVAQQRRHKSEPRHCVPSRWRATLFPAIPSFSYSNLEACTRKPLGKVVRPAMIGNVGGDESLGDGGARVTIDPCNGRPEHRDL